MKAKLILFLILSTTILKAQTWAPIGAKWYYSKFENLFPNHLEGYVLIESVKDTVINGIDCKKLNKTYFASDGHVENWEPEYTYLSDSIIYYKSGESFIELYNFKKGIGDSIAVRGEGYNACTDDTLGMVIIVEKFDTVISSVQFLKYKTEEVENTYWNFDKGILERVGSLDYMFPLQVFCGIFDVLQHAGPLRCYEDPEIGLFKFHTLECDSMITLAVNQEKNVLTTPTIYPNPFVREVYLKWSEFNFNKDYTIQILNPSGQIVYKNQKIASNQKIDLYFLDKGVYFVNLIDNKKYTIVKLKIVKI